MWEGNEVFGQFQVDFSDTGELGSSTVATQTYIFTRYVLKANMLKNCKLKKDSFLPNPSFLKMLTPAASVCFVWYFCNYITKSIVSF